MPPDRGCAVPPVFDPEGATRLCCAAGGAASLDPPDVRSPPPELDPDDPEEPPEDAGGDEGGLERGTACAPAQRGVASAIATAAKRRTRVGLAINACLPEGLLDRGLPTAYCATLLPVFGVENGRKMRVLTWCCPPALPSAADGHYDAIPGLFRAIMSQPHATTVLGLRHQGKVVMASDGQVTLGQTVVKHQARKVRRLYHDRVLAGFAGAAADGFALFSRFESKLEEHRGNLERAAVELARDWRTDRALRRLEAMMLVADARVMYLVSGTGDLIEPDDGVMGIGSGGPYAMAAARALVRHSALDARAIAEQSMAIAADICVYTNSKLTLEELS